MLTASCSQDVDELAPDTTGSGTVKIQFSLAMGESQSGSRADWGTTTNGTLDNPAGDDGDRVVGDNYENMIDLSKLQVFLFQGTTYLGEVGGLTLTPNSSSTTYTFTGEVTVTGATVSTNASGQKSLSDATIMVTANYDGYVNGNVAVTYNYLFDYIAEAYKADAAASVKQYIPMWGIQTANLVLYEENATIPNTAYDAVKIYMLRSMAKIEVELGGDYTDASGNKHNLFTDGYRITNATTLNKYKQKGYLLPSVPTTPANSTYFTVGNTSAFETEGCINAYSSTVAPTNGLTFNVINEGKSCVIYVPEYVNENELYITLGLQHDNTSIYKEGTTPYTISLNEYKVNAKTGKSEPDSESPLDLVRNHWYKYTINKIENGVDAEITLLVTPWATNQSSVDYRQEAGFSKPITWNNGITNNDVVLNDDNGTASFSFNLTTPKDGKWYAELVHVNGASDAFSFNEAETDSPRLVSGNINSQEHTLTIVAKYKEQDLTENNEFLLKIYVETPALTGTTPRRTDVTNLLGEYTIKQSKPIE